MSNFVLNKTGIKGNIYINNNVVNIKGQNTGKSIVTWSAASPSDGRQSFSGSGLPWPNEEIAYEVPDHNSQIHPGQHFDIYFEYPNSYYNNKILLKPHVRFYSHNLNQYEIVILGEHKYHNRSLTDLAENINHKRAIY